MIRQFAIASVLFFVSLSIQAEVQLPGLLSSHAVLQRERPIHIWGWATPRADLSVEFHRQALHAHADELGNWEVWLSPERAGGPYSLTIRGDGAPKVIEDLLIGDVWLASGQSNMEMPLAGFKGQAVVKDAEKEIAAASHPDIRLLLVPHRSSEYPMRDIDSAWTVCTPESAQSFSAVAYFFGREIAEREHVPIGLIDSTWGGTPADSWVSLGTLGSDANLLPTFASRAQFVSQMADMKEILAAEKREDEAAASSGKSAPKHPWHPDEISWRPAGLYNGMIAPLAPYSVKGFLWYQGESNAPQDRASEYSRLFSALIADWRARFQQGTLPFLYVQISSFNSPDNWGLVRDAQRRTLSVANTAMAVTLDVGQADNIHPPDKETVGARLALAARALAYEEPVVYGSPLFRELSKEIDTDGHASLRVWFDHAEGLSNHGEPIDAFEIAGDDRRFQQAQARIENGSVVVWSPLVARPSVVRYGWASFVRHNIYNAAGLPASTFSSESNPSY